MSTAALIANRLKQPLSRGGWLVAVHICIAYTLCTLAVFATSAFCSLTAQGGWLPRRLAATKTRHDWRDRPSAPEQKQEMQHKQHKLRRLFQDQLSRAEAG